MHSAARADGSSVGGADGGAVAVAATVGALIAPFSAIVLPASSNVRARPALKSPEVGLLHQGDVVKVTACQPDCADREAWALLEGDGAIRMASLRAISAGEVIAPTPTPESLEYGRVGPKGIRIYTEPRLDAKVLSYLRIPRETALRPDPALRARGWRERLSGGFMRARLVEKLTPSTFSGQTGPRLPLAFVIKELRKNQEGGRPAKGTAMHAPDERLRRYDRLPVTQLDPTRVLTDKGWLPRSAVRLIALRSPPPEIPAGASWVHVNLSEQTVTAYEGAVPVYATLMSSGHGQDSDLTHPGLYQVKHKMRETGMHGRPDEPYEVDHVPYALYFNANEAFHGTYWHDHFGTEASHGCINLSLADARWLFDWSPPRLPAGWSEIEAREAALPSLWVLVEQEVSFEPIGIAGGAAAEGPSYSVLRSKKPH